MKQGNLSERYLKNSIFRQIPKTNQKLLVGAGIGNDFSLTENADSTASVGGETVTSMSGLVTADGAGECPEVAFYKAYNNFLCSLGNCDYARIAYFLPKECKDSKIKAYSTTFAELAKEEKIQIVGGNSLVSSSFQTPNFLVTLFGRSSENYRPNKKAICPGFDIVHIGFTGILGTNLLLDKYEDALSQRFTAAFLQGARFPQSSYRVQDLLKVITEHDLISQSKICYIHDVSFGGIYLALWQLGEFIGKGFLIENGKIPLRQETVEICEYLDKNPYYIDGMGGMLLVCEKGSVVTKLLNEKGVMAKVIGRITEGKERLVKITENDIRTLSAEADGFL